MCIACNPGFQFAVRSLSLPSRRKVLKGAVALSAGVPFVAEAVVSKSAKADGGINAQLTSGLGSDQAAGTAQPVTIFTAKKFITMERGAPEATAVPSPASGSSRPGRSMRSRRCWVVGRSPWTRPLRARS